LPVRRSSNAGKDGDKYRYDSVVKAMRDELAKVGK